MNGSLFTIPSEGVKKESSDFSTNLCPNVGAWVKNTTMLVSTSPGACFHFNRWTQDKRAARDDEIKQTILKMWLRCRTQDEVAEAVGIPRQTVVDKIAEFAESTQMRETGIFGNFTPNPTPSGIFRKPITKSAISGTFRRRKMDSV